MRRRQAVKRQITSDPKYSSKIVAKLINIIMIKGKKSIGGLKHQVKRLWKNI